MISLVALALACGSSKPLDSEPGSDCEASDWYEDGDGDGWGARLSGSSCVGPVGHVSVGGDCDDADSTVHPSAKEDCDGFDQDCDGLIDEEGPSLECWGDSDGDSFGTDLESSSALCVCPDGSSSVSGDCDDEDPSVHPGADESWYDGVDQDCAEDDDYDADRDGWPVDEDCEEGDPAVNPGAEEICNNGVDDDCDGLPGRCGTEGEVDWSYATDVIVGADDAEAWYLGGTLASGSSGSRNLIMQRLGVASKGSEVLNQNTMVVV